MSILKVSDVAETVNGIAPPGLAQDWDNVGLLVGDADSKVKSVLLAVDVTSDVVAEAVRHGVSLIVGYHPVIWDPLKTVTASGPGQVVWELARLGISVLSMHTALDAAAGGVNDALAEAVGLADTSPIGDHISGSPMYKLVIFVPVESASRVAEAVFSAGAGAIGNYSHCGFSADGRGTFLPLEGARPAVGRVGRAQVVPEVRFETVVPVDRLEGAVTAMKAAHPYEVPAFDCYRIHRPSPPGLGRFGGLSRPATVDSIVDRLKKYTAARAVGIVGPRGRTVTTAAVCAGSCGNLVNSVISSGCELYVTGEMKHHQAMAARQAGLTCLCLGHSVSERFILRRIASKLKKIHGGLAVRISRADKEPFQWKTL